MKTYLFINNDNFSVTTHKLDNDFYQVSLTDRNNKAVIIFLSANQFYAVDQSIHDVVTAPDCDFYIGKSIRKGV